MALENADLLVVQKGSGNGELRKATVQQLLADIGGGSEVIISDDAPDTDAYTAGTLWWNSDNGNLYVLYEDDDSIQWVQATASAGGGSAGTLQEVTDEGNTTDNDIEMTGHLVIGEKIFGGIFEAPITNVGTEIHPTKGAVHIRPADDTDIAALEVLGS